MMPTCKMNETKLEVNENYEEAELSDVDDDVFVRSGGRNGFRLEIYDNAKKPLMTPRRKTVSGPTIAAIAVILITVFWYCTLPDLGINVYCNILLLNPICACFYLLELVLKTI